uniref:Uncharacterized protein n=1 Tax=Myripristis murdjan TaxID=586833 RepID=A0A667WFZ6_9TELE
MHASTTLEPTCCHGNHVNPKPTSTQPVQRASQSGVLGERAGETGVMSSFTILMPV